MHVYSHRHKDIKIIFFSFVSLPLFRFSFVVDSLRSAFIALDSLNNMREINSCFKLIVWRYLLIL